jgi:hypothetical protein
MHHKNAGEQNYVTIDDIATGLLHHLGMQRPVPTRGGTRMLKRVVG